MLGQKTLGNNLDYKKLQGTVFLPLYKTKHQSPLFPLWQYSQDICTPQSVIKGKKSLIRNQPSQHLGLGLQRPDCENISQLLNTLSIVCSYDDQVRILPGTFSGPSIVLKVYFLYRSLLLSSMHTISFVSYVHGGIRHPIDRKAGEANCRRELWLTVNLEDPLFMCGVLS